jgi:succinoglycan biosynthesis protein ExoA
VVADVDDVKHNNQVAAESASETGRGGRTVNAAMNAMSGTQELGWLTDTRHPVVSVILPVRNEGIYLERALKAILAQDFPLCDMEVIVVDGDSTDDTAEQARRILGLEPRHSSGLAHVAVLRNPERIVPVSMNLGIAQAKGDFVVRVDGHCDIATDYVRRCVELLQTGKYACVGGICITVGNTDSARSIAAAQSSRVGVGNVAFRIGQAEPGPVDTVPFGAWPRQLLVEVGGFDEELVRNQDDELAFRIVQRGGVVWLDPRIRSEYHSRSSLPALWTQYFQYGSYKVRVAQKRGGVASLRHVVPAGFIGAVALSVLVGIVRRQFRWPLALLGFYSAVVGISARQVARRSDTDPVAVAAAMATLHTSYGLGSWHGLWRFRRHFRKMSQPTARNR